MRLWAVMLEVVVVGCSGGVVVERVAPAATALAEVPPVCQSRRVAANRASNSATFCSNSCSRVEEELDDDIAGRLVIGVASG